MKITYLLLAALLAASWVSTEVVFENEVHETHQSSESSESQTETSMSEGGLLGKVKCLTEGGSDSGKISLSSHREQRRTGRQRLSRSILIEPQVRRHLISVRPARKIIAFKRQTFDLRLPLRIKGLGKVSKRTRKLIVLAAKKRVITIRRISRAKKWRRKQQKKLKVYIARCLGRAKRFQRKFLPKAKWFVKTYKKVLRAATKQNKAINRIGFIAIKKRGLKWYKKYAQKKITQIRKVLRVKLTLIQNIILRKTVALLKQKRRFSDRMLRHIIQKRTARLLRSYKKLAQRLVLQTKIYVKRGYKVAIRIKLAKALAKRKVRFSVKILKALKKTIPANKWLSIQIKKLSRAIKIVRIKVRVFAKKNKKIGKVLIRKVKSDCAKIWVKGVKILEKLRKKYIKLGSRKFTVLYKRAVKTQRRILVSQLKRIITVRVRKIQLAIRIRGKAEYRKEFRQLLKCSPRYIKIKRKISAKIFVRQEKAKYASFILRVYTNTLKWYKKQSKSVRYGAKLYGKFLKTIYRLTLRSIKAFAKGIKLHGYRWHVKYNRKTYVNTVGINKRKVKAFTRVIKIKSKVILGKRGGRLSVSAKARFAKQIKLLIKKINRISIQTRRIYRYIRLAPALKKLAKLQQKKLAKVLKGKRVAVKVSFKVRLQRIKRAVAWRKKQNRQFKVYRIRCFVRVRRFQRKFLPRGRGKFVVKAVRQVLKTAQRQHKAILKIGFIAIKKRGLKWYKKFAQPKVKKVQAIIRTKVNFIQRIILRKTAALLRKKVKLSLKVIRRIVLKQTQSLLKRVKSLARRLQRQLKKFVNRGYKVLIGVRKPFRKVKIPKIVLKKLLTKFSVKKCSCTKKAVSANKWFSKQLKKVNRAKKSLRIQARIWYKKNKKVGKWFIRRVKDDIAKKFIQAVTLLNKFRRVHIRIGAKRFNKLYKKAVSSRVVVIVRQLKRRVVQRIRQAKLVLRLRKIPAYKARIALLIKYKPRYVKLARKLSAKIWTRKVTSKFGSFVLRIQRKTKKWYKKQSKNVRVGYKFFRPLISRCYGTYIAVIHAWSTGISRYGYGWYVKYARTKFRYFARVIRRKTVNFVRVLKAKSKNILGRKVGRLSISVRRRFLRQVKTLIKVTTRIGKSFYKKHVRYVTAGWKARKAIKLAKLKERKAIKLAIVKRRKAIKLAKLKKRKTVKLGKRGHGRRRYLKIGRRRGPIVVPLATKSLSRRSSVLRYKIKGLRLPGRRGDLSSNIILNVHVPRLSKPKRVAVSHRGSSDDKVVCSCRRVKGGLAHYH